MLADAAGSRLPRAAAALLLILLGSGVDARIVRFGVVAFGGVVQVAVNGVKHRMGPPDIYAPYYWGKYDVPDTFTYKYIVDGVAEPFDRAGPDASASRTFNDFYGRENTVLELPRLPHPFGDSWTRSIGLTPLFDDSYIPTVHLAGDPARINNVWADMRADNTANVTMTVVMASYVKRFENVRYAISAAGRSQNYAKQAYRLKLAKGDSLFGRDEWKLRCGEEDPTQIREKTYSRILMAMACPVIHSNHVRLYVNKEPVGLFVMGDDANQKSTIRTLFHGVKEFALTTKQTGAIYEANAFAFGESSIPSGSLVQYQLGDNPASDPWRAVLKMTNAVAAAGDDAGLDLVNEYLDLETYMRAHAMEFLTFHWDSAWLMGSNFMLYEDSKFTKKFYFSDQDFDQTMGIAVSAADGGSDAATIPYTGFPPGNASYPSQLMPKILASAKYSARFKEIIIAVVKHLFNPVALGEHFKAVHARLAPEVAWDRAAPRRQNGKPDNWVYADYVKGLTAGVGQAQWGLLQWVQQRSQSLASQHGFAWDAKAAEAPAPVVTPPAEETYSYGSAKSGISKDAVKAAAATSAGLSRGPSPAALAAALAAASAVRICP